MRLGVFTISAICITLMPWYLHIAYIQYARMTAQIRQGLKALYHQHGIYTFLFFFVPLLPGIVENRTKFYLTLTKLLTGNVNNTHDSVRILFGQRGQAAFNQYLENHKPIILPSEIFKAFYQDNQPQLGIKLLGFTFFDRAQRRHQHSHIFRETLIKEYPLLLEAYKAITHSPIRFRLIQMLASESLIEQSPDVKCVILDTVNTLLAHTSHIERKRRQYLQDLQLEMIAQKIKAELAGRATAADPDFCKLIAGVPHHKHLLSQNCVSTLKSIITNYLEDFAPDVKELATTHFDATKTLSLSLQT